MATRGRVCNASIGPDACIWDALSAEQISLALANSEQRTAYRQRAGRFEHYIRRDSAATLNALELEPLWRTSPVGFITGYSIDKV